MDLLEKIHVELLKSGSGEGLSKVLSVKNALNLYSGLVLAGQSTLCFLNLGGDYPLEPNQSISRIYFP